MHINLAELSQKTTTYEESVLDTKSVSFSLHFLFAIYCGVPPRGHCYATVTLPIAVP
jgi:hypothetical protein